jgi:hypothetical protein
MFGMFAQLGLCPTIFGKYVLASNYYNLYIDWNTNGPLVGPDSDLNLNTITGSNFISFSLTGINFISDPHLAFFYQSPKNNMYFLSQ